MKLYKLIFIVLLSSTININANLESESWQSWVMNLNTDKHIQPIIEQLLNGPNKAQKIVPKALVPDVATPPKIGCDALNKQMTNFDIAKKVTSTDVATPTRMGCDTLGAQLSTFNAAGTKIQKCEGLEAQLPDFGIAKKVIPAAAVSAVTQSADFATPTKVGCNAFGAQLPDFTKAFHKLKPSTKPNTSFTTRFLDTLDDPWVRIAVVAGIIVYARYQYNQSQKQLKEFDEEEEKKTLTA